jgi:glycosyltransferase involved in cell wall biosynthesis
MVEPIIDIVVPTFNQADLLRECLKSVIAQEFKNWNCWVVDNFSTDHTIQVVGEFHDTRIHYSRYKNHGIIAASRNFGVSQGSASLVAFLDSDDLWYPSKLRRGAQIFEAERDLDLLCHDEHWMSTSGKKRRIRYGPGRTNLKTFLFRRGNCLSTSAVMMRREVFEALSGFSENPAFVTAEDYEFWVRIANAGFTIRFLHEVLGIYRIHELSSSAVAIRNHEACLAVIDSMYGPDTDSVKRSLTHRLAWQYYSYARALHRNGDHQQALRTFRTSLKLAPYLPRTIFATILSLFRLAKKEH